MLLAVGFVAAGPAEAVASPQGALPAASFNFDKLDRVAIQSRASEKPVCVHVTSRTQETCLACSASLVMTIVSRVRPKAPGPREKSGSLYFRDIQASLAAGREAVHLPTIIGVLSQASATGYNILFRTGRLRI